MVSRPNRTGKVTGSEIRTGESETLVPGFRCQPHSLYGCEVVGFELLCVWWEGGYMCHNLYIGILGIKPNWQPWWHNP